MDAGDLNSVKIQHDATTFRNGIGLGDFYMNLRRDGELEFCCSPVLSFFPIFFPFVPRSAGAFLRVSNDGLTEELSHRAAAEQWHGDGQFTA